MPDSKDVRLVRSRAERPFTELAACRKVTLRGKVRRPPEGRQAMMTRHERFPLEWRPERLRRLLDLDFDLSDSLRVEEFGDEDHFVITAEAPGLDPAKDVEITVSDDVLRIRVHRSQRTEHKNKESYRSEFRYGELVRDAGMEPISLF